MGLFKSQEERQHARAQSEERRAEARARDAAKRHAETPLGRAQSAAARGDSLLQLSIPAGPNSGQVLSSIEAAGWHLEHVGFTQELDVSSMSNLQDQVQSISSASRQIGTYVFRNSSNVTDVQRREVN